MKYPILILLFLISLSSFSQNKTIFIKDKVSKEPINLVAISTQKGTGTYSEEDGSFTLALSTFDTLTISHVSYKKIILSKRDIEKLSDATIFLSPKTIELNESVVKPTKLRKKMIGYYKEKTFFKRVGPGGKSDFNVFVNHFKNISKEIGFFDKLYFDLFVDITEGGNSKVRVRMFSVGSDGLPKDDILTKEIIKKIDRFTPNLRINISDLNIPFPPEGVFIGLEFFCNFETKKLKQVGHYKSITNCPHIPTAKVSNYEEIGNSYYWTTLKNNKFQWVCYSNGSVYPGTIGHVYKFGAEISQ